MMRLGVREDGKELTSCICLVSALDVRLLYQEENYEYHVSLSTRALVVKRVSTDNIRLGKCMA